MLIVKIDRSTIKKNPEAGSTQTHVSGPATCSFKITGGLPEGVSEDEVVVHSRIIGFPEGEILEGDLLNLEKAELFKGGEVTLRHEIKTINHLPKPDYFYEYHNPLIECDECGLARASRG